jgi:hypothetical protein
MLRPSGGTEACFLYATSPYIAPFGGMIAIMHTPDYTADDMVMDYNDYVFWSGKGSEFMEVEAVGEIRKVTAGHHIYRFPNPQPYVRIGFTPATDGQKVRLAVSLKRT